MSTHKTSDRRKLLIGLSSGVIGASQLPGSWSKPIVDAVVLPSHAETTDDSGTLPPENTTTAEPVITEFSGAYSMILPSRSAKTDFLEDALGLMVPNAHAGFENAEGQICMKVSSPVGSGASYTVSIQVNQSGSSAIFTGNGTVNGGNATVAIDSSCGQPLQPPLFNVSSASNAGAAYTLFIQGATSFEGMLGTEYNCPTAVECN